MGHRCSPRTRGVRGQLVPNGQRLCQESIEGVPAAIGPGVDSKHHSMATVAGRSVGILLTMYPDGIRLKRKGQKRWRI